MQRIITAPVDLVNWAASRGMLRYLKYFIENTLNAGTTDAVDSAAFYGHFEIVKYLRTATDQKGARLMLWIMLQKVFILIT
jgi:hypothetical protein